MSLPPKPPSDLSHPIFLERRARRRFLLLLLRRRFLYPAAAAIQEDLLPPDLIENSDSPPPPPLAAERTSYRGDRGGRRGKKSLSLSLVLSGSCLNSVGEEGEAGVTGGGGRREGGGP